MSFWTGLGYGIFSGFNDWVEAESAHKRRLEEIDRSKVEKSPEDVFKEFETISYTDASGKQHTENLYEIPLGWREKYTEDEYKDEVMGLFFNSDWMTPKKMNALIQKDPYKAGAIIKRGDEYSYKFNNDERNRTVNVANGITLYRKGPSYVPAQNSWHAERFNAIQLGKIPLNDYGIPALQLETDDTILFKQSNMTPQDYGYPDVNELKKDLAEIRYQTSDNRPLNLILGSLDPTIMKAYKQLKPLFAKINKSQGYIGAFQLEQMAEYMNGVDLSKLDKNGNPLPNMPDMQYDSQKQFQLFRLVAPEAVIKPIGHKFWFMTDPEKYAAEYLGMELKNLNAKKMAAAGAERTIQKLLSQLFRADGSPRFGPDVDDKDLPLYSIAAWLKKFTSGFAGSGGLLDQVKSVLGNSFEIENESTTKSRWKRLFGKKYDMVMEGGEDKQLGAIMEREVLYELLAYQVASAIQGGTGGRTISDQDVANIKRALGLGGLYTKAGMQYDRLTALSKFMQEIYIINANFADGGGIKSLVAANNVHRILLGGGIKEYTSERFARTFTNYMKNLEENGQVTPVNDEAKQYYRFTVTNAEGKQVPKRFSDEDDIWTWTREVFKLASDAQFNKEQETYAQNLLNRLKKKIDQNKANQN